MKIETIYKLRYLKIGYGKRKVYYDIYLKRAFYRYDEKIVFMKIINEIYFKEKIKKYIKNQYIPEFDSKEF